MSTAEASPSSKPRAKERTDALIEGRIAEACQALWWAELVRALLRLIIGWFAVLLGWAILDHWLLSPTLTVRVAAFLALIGFSGWYVTRYIVPLIASSIRPEYAARSLERDFPEMRQSLTSYVTLRETSGKGLRSNVVRSIGHQAAGWLRRHDALPAEATGTLRFWLVAAAALAIFFAYAIWSPKNTFQSVARLMAPVAAIDPPRRVEITAVRPGDAEAMAGRRVDVSARITGLNEEESVWCRWEAAGETQQTALTFDPSTGRHIGSLALEYSASGNVSYRIAAGDAVAGPFRLSVRDVPVVAVESVRYEPPDYTGEQPRNSSSGAITGLDGTVVTIRARTNRSVDRAQIEFNPRSLGDSVRATAGVAEMQLDADGRKLSVSFRLEAAQGRAGAVQRSSYRVKAWDEADQSNPQPIIYPIRVNEDLPPEVSIVLPQQTPKEIPVDAQQIIEVHALDADYGLQRIGLEMRRGIDAIAEPTLWRDRSGVKGNQVAEYRFRPAELGLRVGDVVQVRAVAADNRQLPSDPTVEPNVATTDPVELKISQPGEPLTPDPAAADGLSAPDDQPPSEQTDEPSDQQNRSEPAAEGQSQESQSQESQSQESQSQESQSQESQSQESQSGKGQSSEGQSGQSGQSQSGEGQSGQGQSGEGQSGEGQSGEGQSGEGQSGEGQSGQGRSESGQTDGDPSSQNQPGQNQPGQRPSDPNRSSGEPSGEPQSAQGESGEQNQPGEQSQQSPSGQAGQDAQQSSGHQTDSQSPSGGAGSETGSSGSEASTPESAGNRGAPPNPSAGDSTPQTAGGQSQSASGDTAAATDSSASSADRSNGESSSGESSQQPPQHDGEAFERIRDYLNEQQQQADQPAQPEPGQEATQREQGNDGEQGSDGEQDREGKQAERSTDQGQQRPEPAGSSPQPSGGQDRRSADSVDPMAQQSETPSPTAQDSQGNRDSPSEPGESDRAADQRPSNDSVGGENKGASAESTSDPSGRSSDSGDTAEAGKSSESGESGSGDDERSGRGQTPSASGDRSGRPKGEGATQEKPSDGQRQGEGQGEGEEQRGGEGSGERQNQSEGPSQGDGESQGKGETRSEGDTQREGESEDAGEDAREPSRRGGDQEPSQPRSADQQSGDRQPPSGRQPSSQPATQGGSGSAAGTAGTGAPPGDAPPAPDPVDTQYAEKATDMVLDYLEETRDAPDRELLDRLNWSEEDLQRFTERWQRLRETDPAEAGSSDGDPQLEEALKSLGLRPPAGDASPEQQDTDDALRGLRDSGNRRPPPPAYRDAFEAFQRSIGRPQ